MQYNFVTVNPRSPGFSPPIPWTSTGLSIPTDLQQHRLTVIAVGWVHAHPPTFNLPWVGPDGDSGHFGCAAHIPSEPDMKLLARVGTQEFAVGSFYDVLLPLGYVGDVDLIVNDCDNYYHDNRGFFYALVVIDAPGEPLHEAPCPWCNILGAFVGNPIKMRDGDK